MCDAGELHPARFGMSVKNPHKDPYRKMDGL